MLSRSAPSASAASAGCPTYWPPATPNAIIDYLYIRDWEAEKKTFGFLSKETSCWYSHSCHR